MDYADVTTRHCEESESTEGRLARRSNPLFDIWDYFVVPSGLLAMTLVFAMIFSGCARQPAPPRMSDSVATANSVQRMEGKHFHIFRGPADVLGDTTKNQRKPPMVREP
jgi:hypothetical protein